MFDTIVQGTRRVLEFAAAAGTQKFLFVSSGAVYGRQPSDIVAIPENYSGGPDQLIPASAYGEGKRAAELQCVLLAQRHGFAVKIARCFAFVGPHLPLEAHFAVGNFLRDALARRPIRIKGDGQPYRAYLYAADMAAWLWLVLCQGANERAYNVGGAQSMTLAATAELVRAIGGGGPVTVMRAVEPTPASRYVADCTRIQKELVLPDSLDLESSVRRTLAWLAAANFR